MVAPATPYDAKGLLKSSVRDEDPVLFLEHKRTYRLVRGEAPDVEYTLPIGVADVKMEGDDMSVITYGLMLHHCLEAARSLAREGVSVEVIDLRTIRPLDEETIGKAIINYPQAAILNTEAIVKRPVVVNDAIAIRSMMNLCLTFDHRILDGIEAGTFLAGVRRRLEVMGPEMVV